MNFAFQKLNFKFFLAKKQLNDLKWLRNKKNTLQQLIYSIIVFYLHNFLIYMYLIFLTIFLQIPYGTTP